MPNTHAHPHTQIIRAKNLNHGLPPRARRRAAAVNGAEACGADGEIREARRADAEGVRAALGAFADELDADWVLPEDVAALTVVAALQARAAAAVTGEGLAGVA